MRSNSSTARAAHITYFALAISAFAAAPTARAQVVGACCTAGSCTLTTQGACTGAYHGDFTDCQGGIPSIYTRSPNLSIPDGACPQVVADAIMVSDVFTVTHVSVRVQIPDHTYISDLRIRLAHTPGSVEVFNGVCDDETGLDLTFDDQGEALICSSPTFGFVNPVSAGGQSLSPFAGAISSGAWTLVLCDASIFDTGTLASWSLILHRAGPAPCGPTGPDCFTRSAPPVGGRWVRGGPNGVSDETECVGDWDRNSQLTPADVAAFVATWFFSAQNPGNLDADIDCNGQVAPADVASFVQHWLGPLQNPGTLGCAP